VKRTQGLFRPRQLCFPQTMCASANEESTGKHHLFHKPNFPHPPLFFNVGEQWFKFFISIILDSDSGSFNEIVENAPCTSASTPQPRKRARTTLADNDTEWTHVDRVHDIAIYFCILLILN
jgi:hypothetical protein